MRHRGSKGKANSVRSLPQQQEVHFAHTFLSGTLPPVVPPTTSGACVPQPRATLISSSRRNVVTRSVAGETAARSTVLTSSSLTSPRAPRTLSSLVEKGPPRSGPIIQGNQRKDFPVPRPSFVDESGLGAKTRATQMRAEDLLNDFMRMRREQLECVKAHCSVDVSAEGYDAIDGAEQAVLYISRPIGEDDFHQLPKIEEFDSRFAEIMTLFISRDLSQVVKPGSDSVDRETLSSLSRQALEQAGAPEEETGLKKTRLFKSFRQAQDHLLETSESPVVGPPPRNAAPLKRERNAMVTMSRPVSASSVETGGESDPESDVQ